MTTREEVRAHIATGSWRSLERAAVDLAGGAQVSAASAFVPVLGGGTRLMLALEHRISEDIDLFIDTPQWIGYLTPRLTDTVPAGCRDYEEGSTFLKFRFPEGEVDFIVGLPLLGVRTEVDERSAFAVEPIDEVIAKKLFYRGWALTPRDLLDWHAVGHSAPSLLDAARFGALLSDKHLQGIAGALAALVANPGAARKWAELRAVDPPKLPDAAAWATAQLQQWRVARELRPRSTPVPGRG